MRAQDSTLVWRRNILRDFAGRNIPWLLSESSLVDGNQVIVTPGGPNAGMMALDNDVEQGDLDQQRAERPGRLRLADRLPTYRVSVSS